MIDFSKITTIILDVDGVLTDGTVQAYATGEQVRTFYIKDGYALDRAVKAGYNVAIISGGLEIGVKKRLEFLGVKDIFMNVKDKVESFQAYIKDKNIDPATVLYMGDDVPDIKISKLVGISTCPNDAAIDVKENASFISPFNGGKGAVRDIIEKVMRAQGKWTVGEWL
jgi:3-deoxy-D-manno-octulosonate 8-phosphate phosphatase (KDO 8-P phosphatase)